MADEKETHYVARVVIERVDKVTTKSLRNDTADQVSRDVSEVTSFTVKAKELDTLKGRIQSHVGLVDE